MDYGILHTELTIDPESLGYAPAIASGADGDLEVMLNAPRYPVVGKLDIGSLQAWMMAESVPDQSGRSIWCAMKEAAAGVGPEAAAAQEALDLMSSRLGTVDLSLPRPAALLADYAAAGLITEDQQAALVVAATRMQSRAERLGLGSVSSIDIATALRG